MIRFLREFRLLPQTTNWLKKQPDAAQAIDKLVTKAEAEEQNALIAATGSSVAGQELEICYRADSNFKTTAKASGTGNT